jgi:hypothetical protein
MVIVAMLFSQVALGAPLIAPAINSSRVVPGSKVTTDEVAGALRKVKVIGVSDVSGPQSERFADAAIAALNDEHQGQYRSAADVSAGVVDGVGTLTSVATGLVSNLAGVPGLSRIPGLNKVEEVAEEAIESGTEKIADKLDGVNRHPAEGFGIVRGGPSTQDRVRAGAEKVVNTENVWDQAASVAGMVGAKKVEDALNLGEGAAKVTAAFFRAGAEGNSPDFVGVHLPIRAVAGSGDAQLSAKTSVSDLGTEEFKKKIKRKKKNAKGEVIKDKNGKPVWETVEVDCTRRNVEVKVRSELRIVGGATVMQDLVDIKTSDDACGKDRAKELKSASEIAGPVIAGAGARWGSYVQPQMDTIRLKFNPNGSTALAVDHVMNNRHTAAMCLLQDALTHNPADPFAQYSKAVLLEAWGRYGEAAPLYTAAEADEAFSGGRWDNGARRVTNRKEELRLLEAAYGMVAAPTAFPFADTCPAVDRSGTTAVVKWGQINPEPDRGDGRRLEEGELLRVLGETDGKWTKVQQLDGSFGWVMAKRVFQDKD